MSDLGDIKPETLPGILCTIAKVAGVSAAIKCAETHGGTAVHFPKKPTDACSLLNVLSKEQISEVANSMGQSERYTIPSMKSLRNHRRAVTLRLQGKTIREIASAIGLSQRQVQRLIGGVAKGSPDAA